MNKIYKILEYKMVIFMEVEKKLIEICKNSEDKTKCKLEVKNILKGISNITGLTSDDLIAIIKEPEPSESKETETLETKASEPSETEPEIIETEETQIKEETE